MINIATKPKENIFFCKHFLAAEMPSIFFAIEYSLQRKPMTKRIMKDIMKIAEIEVILLSIIINIFFLTSVA